MKFRHLLFPLVLMAVSTAGQAQRPKHGRMDAATIKSIVAASAGRFLARYPQAAGVAIGVIAQRGNHEYTFGRARRDRPGAPALDTIYPIASISKTFTGLLLAQAQIEHRLRVSDDVRAHLAGAYPNLEYDGKPIRLFDLLDHRSGLPFLLPDRPETRPDYSVPGPGWNERLTEIAKTYGKADFLTDLHGVRFQAEPGTTFSYSNAGAQLAGYVLERVYGQSFEAVLRQGVLEPLHMADTFITVPKRDAARVAVGYDADGKKMAPVPNLLQGAGAIKSSLGDMLKYARWQVSESDQAVKLSHQPVFTQGAYSAAPNWQIIRSGGRRIVWQEGNIEGFNSLCILQPELGIAIVILTNEEDPKSAHGNTVMANDILRGLDADSVLLPTS